MGKEVKNMKKIAFVLTCLLSSALVGCNNANEVQVSQVNTTTVEETTVEETMPPVDLEEVYQEAISNGYEDGFYYKALLSGDCIKISFRDDLKNLSLLDEVVLNYFKEPLEKLGINYDLMANRMEMSTPSDGSQTEESDGIMIIWNVTEDVDLLSDYWRINIQILKK